ncbi:MAG: hypothetical protein ACREFY_17665, partial [Acetobacteraceae bacterium]
PAMPRGRAVIAREAGEAAARKPKDNPSSAGRWVFQSTSLICGPVQPAGESARWHWTTNVPMLTNVPMIDGRDRNTSPLLSVAC